MSASDTSPTLERRGLLLVLSSPSGAGKTTITRRLVELEGGGVEISISHTTRPKRPDEMDGRDYHFVDQAAFARLRERGEFLESAEVFGHWYGTTRDPVERARGAGRDVVFDIDWQGSQQLAEAVRGDLVRVFILPPSLQALEQRLNRRAQDSPAVVAERMSRAADEMSHHGEYDYVVVNTALETAVDDVRAILRAERLRRQRLKGLDGFVSRLTAGSRPARG
ncbi:MAG: guanylate kinase [Rhodospirillales bacterium]|nr:guanylate kinase [Rhodospirillales bacterium]MDE0381768.1 guanylate kinase [Rhodospirillales bacterium]